MKQLSLIGLIATLSLAAISCSNLSEFQAAESVAEVTPTPTPSGFDWRAGGGNSTGTSEGAGGRGR